MNNEYKRQFRTTLINFITAGALSLVITLYLYFQSRSLLFLVQCVGSVCSCIVLGMYMMITRKLALNKSYEYEYGMGKFESISTFLGYIIQDMNLLLLIYMSVLEFVSAAKEVSFGWFSYFYVVGCIVMNGYLYLNFRRQLADNGSGIAAAQSAETLRNLVMKLVYLGAMLLVTIFSEIQFVYRIQYIVCIGIIIVMLFKSLEPLKKSVNALLDRCVDEDMSMKIVSLLAKHALLYNEFFTYRTRVAGNNIFLDVFLNYDSDMTVETALDNNQKIETALESAIPNCKVNCIIVSGERYERISR